MPTPSDPTAIQPKSYAEMAKAAQASLDEQARAIQQQRDLHETVTQAFIPNKGVPPVSGDCILEERDESESERTSESASDY
jgi:hypothetical protein